MTDPRGTIGDRIPTTTTQPKISNTEADALQQTTTFHYTDGINVTSIDRPDGATETKFYDAMNRMLTDTVPQTSTVNLITTFVYNPSGTIYSVTDANNDTTTFDYWPSDLKMDMYYPGNSQYQQWTYDNDYNLASRRTVNGEVQSFTYDNRNRQTQMSWSNNADWSTFGYDRASRLTSATNANSTVTRRTMTPGDSPMTPNILWAWALSTCNTPLMPMAG